MAFTGTPIVTQITDSVVRITGIAVPEGSGPTDGQGTIGLSGATGDEPDVRLPAAFKPRPYEYAGNVLSLQDVISVSFVLAEGEEPLCNPAVEKTGTTEEDFRITFFNGVTPTPNLEIWVKYHL
jgi:hypothetical protein